MMRPKYRPIFILVILIMAACGPSDGELTEAVRAELEGVEGLENVEVAVDAGIAQLTGQVESEEMKETAGGIAENVKGITEVANSIIVDVSMDDTVDSVSMSDSELKEKVKANFQEYQLDNINIEVDNGVVTLTGEIREEELHEVMSAAMESGADKVINKLTVTE
ncbi:BON domain-containing protein [Mangrovivirga sp. M17]|uniref:BON domain-containing protein n=1 Tax=Mangrovivirga halotolerans TaxID=2993936 RepID=A0ABT3RNH4_9BACT|nr:BON domain-containing protein [Mangrovivirga halotolerans]MCX2743142.1 BON domain-containing protein [Mangrovivirga halotolerans]